MKLNRTVVALGLAMLLATPVLAQEGAPADPASPPEDVEGKLEGMDEQLQTLQSDVDKLKKFKFSGYIQARYDASESSSDTVRVTGSPAVITPANLNRFYIRRARLKLTYDSSPLSQGVVYFDGGTDRTIRLLEAYVTLLDPWTPLHQHGLTVGQFNIPFGYEIERSSSVRELPERSRAENVLFNGERDRGLKIVSQWTPQVETVLGAFNGGGVNHADFPNTDPTQSKDFTGRVRFSQGRVDGAASYYGGRNTVPLAGDDVEHDKTRLGLDAQAYYELPTVGGGSLKAEFYTGKEVNPDSVRTMTVSNAGGRVLRPDVSGGSDPSHFATDFVGWYAMWVQNVGEKLQFAARYDTYDPNDALDLDQYERVSLGLNWFYDGFTRLTVAYDMVTTRPSPSGTNRHDVDNPATRPDDPKDNLWTIQFQHKF